MKRNLLFCLFALTLTLFAFTDYGYTYFSEKGGDIESHDARRFKEVLEQISYYDGNTKLLSDYTLILYSNDGLQRRKLSSMP